MLALGPGKPRWRSPGIRRHTGGMTGEPGNDHRRRSCGFTMKSTIANGGQRTSGRVVVVGAGPVGMTAALALARGGVPTLVLEKRDGLSEVGSRAIGLVAHLLQAWERLGVVEPILRQGVRLIAARTFFGDVELKHLDLQFPSPLPPIVMLQQTRTERALLDALERTSVGVEFGR